MRIPLNIAGGSYEHKSRALTNQVTRNFWPKLIETEKAKSRYVLESFYGLKIFKEFSGGLDRGMLKNNNLIYRVVGTTLYSVTSDGTHTTIGTIPGTERCMLKAIGSQVIIINGSGALYVWNGTTLTLNTDPGIGSPRGATVVNNQAIYDEGAGQRFSVSDVALPLTVNGLNYAAAESFPDDLLIPYGYKETLMLMGADGIELWWNSGQGNPPFDKIQGGGINIGLGAIHSVADNPDYVFLLGSDRNVYTVTGGASAVVTVISTAAMAKQFQAYGTISDAVGWTMQLEKQWFYVLTFPTQNITWCYPVGGEWFEWGTGPTGRIRANSYVNIFGKHLVGDYQSGNLYELSAETYDDVGEEIIRRRDSAPFHPGLIVSNAFGNPNDLKEYTINALELSLDVADAPLTGQGSDPEIMISTSRDGGKTFGTQRIVKVGVLEDQKVLIKNLGRFKSSCVFRFETSDPVYWNLFNGVADVEICI
jgi:hypothetical protein